MSPNEYAMILSHYENEDKKMANFLYDKVYIKNYDQTIENLSQMILPEYWGVNYNILKNYLAHTLKRLFDEKKVYTSDSMFAFNTGLFTSHYEEVYFVAKPCKYGRKDWIFDRFCTEYNLDVENLPQRADYFTNPSLLIYNYNLPLRIQYGHILQDHPDRLPECISVESPGAIDMLRGVIDNSLCRIVANYKLAVPQYYNGNIQLLAPLYFEAKDKPDLALVLQERNGYYQASTTLTLDLAYNNARLITKPESNWLSIE